MYIIMYVLLQDSRASLPLVSIFRLLCFVLVGVGFDCAYVVFGVFLSVSLVLLLMKAASNLRAVVGVPP